jgi:hypothetical protein
MASCRNASGGNRATKAGSRARQQSAAENLPLTAIREDTLKFDYGKDRWDLIAVMYMGSIATSLANQITAALKPGGVARNRALFAQAGRNVATGQPVAALRTITVL